MLFTIFGIIGLLLSLGLVLRLVSQAGRAASAEGHDPQREDMHIYTSWQHAPHTWQAVIADLRPGEITLLLRRMRAAGVPASAIRRMEAEAQQR